MIKEKSGDNRLRDDKTISWYHELTPILYFLDLVRQGDIKLCDLEEYGGLGTAIRTHLRHDSVEDSGISFDQLHTSMLIGIQRLEDTSVPNFDASLITQKTDIVVDNIRLMTRKVAILDNDGKPVYENGKLKKRNLFNSTASYIENMISAETANPVVYALKLGDGIHNLRFIGSEKFTAERRHKYCMEREDMYGARRGFTDLAQHKWPEFAPAIAKLDSLMGALLYTNIGYLEYVDFHYPDKHKKGDRMIPIGLGRYLDKALSFNVPRAFSIFHTNLDRTIAEAKTNLDTEKFLRNALGPTLISHKEHFPEFFDNIARIRKPIVFLPKPE